MANSISSPLFQVRHRAHFRGIVVHRSANSQAKAACKCCNSEKYTRQTQSSFFGEENGQKSFNIIFISKSSWTGHSKETLQFIYTKQHFNKLNYISYPRIGGTTHVVCDWSSSTVQCYFLFFQPQSLFLLSVLSELRDILKGHI